MENIMRRKSVVKLQKFTIIFFALLLVFIWVNHGSRGDGQDGPKEAPVEHFPQVEPKSDQEVTPHPKRVCSRADRMKRFQERLLRVDSEKDVLTSPLEDPKDDDDDDDDEAPFMSDVKRRKWKSKPPSRFFVSSSKCRMPYADPFSNEAVALLNNVEWKNCSHDGHIFALKFDQKLQQYRLKVNATLLARLEPNVPKFKCNYREFANNSVAHWQSFHREAIINRSPSGIVAECHGALSTPRIVQQDAFPLVQVPYRQRCLESHPLDRRPSVIMLGLEGLSRMNFKRTMPRTAKFVQEAGWFEMEGYNKVGDSAFSSLCAIFGGAKSDTSCMKLFPVMWQAFKKAGYTTAFGEDILESSVRPELRTDYQLRALLEDISKSMGSGQRLGFQSCIGRRLSFSYLYDFCIQFAQRLIEELDQPAFGLFWSSSFTRNHHLGATGLDQKFVEYLQLMREHKVFERAIVVLFSDQGQSSGELVDLADGHLEERLPLLHIHLPPWFRAAYPKFADNLLSNRNRLSSPFDLHNTLRHILNLKASVPQELATLAKCRNSQSLMHLIPLNRSCEEACIGLHWCACNEFVLLPNNADSYYLGKVFVYHINVWMLHSHHNRACQRLRLSGVDYVERAVAEDPSSHGSIGIFRLRISTLPEGVFQSTVRYDMGQGKMVDINVKEISSMSDHNHGDCVKDSTAKKFCYCYPNIKDAGMKYWMTQL